MNSSAFRRWVQNIWYDHVEELRSWESRNPDYTAKEYFAKYKWWLRREFRHQFLTDGK